MGSKSNRVKDQGAKLFNKANNHDQSINYKDNYLRTIIETTTDGFMIVDSNGKIIDVNRSYCSMTGYSRNELIGMAISDIDDNESPEATSARINRIIEKGGELFETRHRRKDSTVFDVEISTTYMAKEGGLFACFCRDITSRNEAGREITRMADMLDLAPGAITVHDVNGDFVYTNKRNLELHGFTKEEFLKKSITEIDAPESRELIKTRLEQIREKGEATFEALHYRKDGTTFPLKLYVKMIDWSGKPAMLSIGTDIEDIRKTEQALRESEKKYRQLTENMSDIVWTADMSLKTTYVSPSVENILGFTPEQHMARRLEEKHPPESLNKLREAFAEEIKKEADPGTDPQRTRLLEVQQYHADGRDLWVSMNISAIRDENGVMTGIQGVTRDITENKIASEALRESEEKYRQLFNNMTQGFALHEVINDKEGKPIDYRYLNVNPAFEKLTGVKAGTLVGRTVLEVMPDTEPYWIEIFGSVANTGNPVKYENYSKSISKYFDVWAFSPRKGQFAVIFSDITRRKLAEKAIQENEIRLKEQNDEYMTLNEELSGSNKKIKIINEELKKAWQKAEESDKLKTAFLANMSHEIRTPMNAIIGFSEIMLNPALSKERRENFTKIINSSCHQLLNLINDIIDIAKIETGQMNLHEEEININRTISEIEKIYTPLIQDKIVDLEISYGLPDNQATIITDPVKFKQIITNLVHNAFKFTDKGTITIGYRLNEKFIEFYVKDSGPGINSLHHEVIFERFRQLSSNDKKVNRGTGLGLPICKALTEMLGGSIWLKSEAGEGSAFYFSIPYKSKDNPENIRNMKTFDTYNFNGIKILVAEDEETNFLFINELIEETGATIVHAENGKEAVTLFNDNDDIRIILMDIKMPLMDGITATKLIKEVKPDVPVIAITAYAMSGDKEKCINAGCDDYLSKPVRRTELLDLISFYLNKRPAKA